jgi:F-type H+-transporting ATPase subunit epsilon
MHLEIITPEAKVFSGEANAVQLPGNDGVFQVLNNHAPIIAALNNGIVKVDLEKPFEAEKFSNKIIEKDNSDSKVIRVQIKGGVVELTNNKLIVLAE